MTEKKYDVIHIGEANHDIRVPDVPDAFMEDKGESYVVGNISDGCGGDALNVAICLSHLGDHSAFYGRVQSTYPGTRLKELIEEQGVDTSLTIMADDCHTPDIICTIMGDGSHRFLIGRREHWGLKPEEIDPQIIASGRVLSIGSLFTLDELDGESLKNVLRICRDAGVIVVADMTYDINGLGPHHFDDVYRYIDYLVPSWDEASYVTGKDHEVEMADAFLALGATNVIIKLGSRGCFFKNREKSFYMDPFEIQPVDTTGCGDNFTGGFIHALLKGLPTEECVRFASAAGSLHALGVGASGVIRSEQMVIDFMRNTPQKKISR